MTALQAMLNAIGLDQIEAAKKSYPSIDADLHNTSYGYFVIQIVTKPYSPEWIDMPSCLLIGSIGLQEKTIESVGDKKLKHIMAFSDVRQAKECLTELKLKNPKSKLRLIWRQETLLEVLEG